MEEEQNQMPAEPTNVVTGPAIVEHHHSASKVLLWIGILIITFAAGAASAWAFLNYQDFILPEVVVNEPVNQEENLPVVEEEEEVMPEQAWNNYSNSNLKVSIKYPIDWTIETVNEKEFRALPLSIPVADRDFSDKNMAITVSIVESKADAGFVSDCSTVTINSYVAERCLVGGILGFTGTFIPTSPNDSELIFVRWNEDISDPIYEQILSSIIVAGDGNIPWNTYSNQTWGFSFQYPPDWIIKTDNLPGEVVIATSPNQSLVIGDLTLFINPGGFGVGCADTNITFERQGSGLEIINEESFIYDDPSNEICYRDPSEDSYDIHAHEQLSEASSIQDRKIYMTISTDDPVRGKNIMTGIISTFKFN